MKKSVTRPLVSALAVSALAIAGALMGVSSAQAATTVVTTITTPDNELYSQYGTAVSPDGSVQAIPAYDSDRVVLAYAATHTYLSVTDPNGDISAPMLAAFSPDGATLYVTNYDDAVVVVIDVATHTVVDTVATPNSENLAVAVSPDGTTLVVADDYDNFASFDITNGYAQITTNNIASYVEAIYFIDNTQAYFLDYNGQIDVFDVITGSQVSTVNSAASGGSYGVCMTNDLSTVIYPYGSDLFIIDATDGSTIATVDLSADATSLAQCTVTADDSQVLVTEWSSSGQVFVVDIADASLTERVEVPEMDDTDGINIMANCEVFVAGYYTNIGVLLLDPSVCTPKAALPDTGASQTLVITLASIGGGLLVLGIVAVILVRRRNAKDE